MRADSVAPRRPSNIAASAAASGSEAGEVAPGLCAASGGPGGAGGSTTGARPAAAGTGGGAADPRTTITSPAAASRDRSSFGVARAIEGRTWPTTSVPILKRSAMRLPVTGWRRVSGRQISTSCPSRMPCSAPRSRTRSPESMVTTTPVMSAAAARVMHAAATSSAAASARGFPARARGARGGRCTRATNAISCPARRPRDTADELRASDEYLYSARERRFAPKPRGGGTASHLRAIGFAATDLRHPATVRDLRVPADTTAW